jgi:hypothetical protein
VTGLSCTTIALAVIVVMMTVVAVMMVVMSVANCYDDLGICGRCQRRQKE